jgi:hypothetical protein
MGKIIAQKNVIFNYFKEPIEVKQNKVVLQKEQPKIRCIIKATEPEDNPEILADAVVALYHKDVNDRLKGREFAFRKAVHTIKDKNLRSELRKAFIDNFKRSPTLASELAVN